MYEFARICFVRHQPDLNVRLWISLMILAKLKNYLVGIAADLKIVHILSSHRPNRCMISRISGNVAHVYVNCKT